MADFNEDWGYSENDEVPGIPEQPQQEQPKTNDSLDIMDDLNELHDLDSEFNNIYKDVVAGNTDMQVFSSNVQRIEINNLKPVITSMTNPEEADKDKELNEDLNKLLNTDSDNILKLFNSTNIQNNRKKLYETYNEIAEINPIAYRMLKVYSDNILVKNMQNKQFLNVIENDQNNLLIAVEENTKKIATNFLKTFLIYFDIQNKLKNNIIPNMLKNGDYYIEIVDLRPVSNIIENRRELITESIFIDKRNQIANFGIIDFPQRQVEEHTTYSYAEKTANNKFMDLLNHKQLIQESDMNLFADLLIDDDEDLRSNNMKGSSFDLNNFPELNFDVLKEIYLKFIQPSSVIKLEVDGINYGYLIIEDIDDGSAESEEINIYQRFMNDDSNNKKTSSKNENITKKIVDVFSKEILGKISTHLSHDANFLQELPEELSLSLKIILYEKIKKRSKLKFRIVEPNKLINFHTNIDKFGPYGTSVFDPIILPVKLYTIALMSSVISRLSRAAVVRKWNIEVGARRNHSQIVQNVQKELKTKNISYDDLSSMKNISQIMTDFRDIATVSKNGQKFIDLEIMPMQDRALPINDLQDLRNELISATGIPSVFLNIGDNIEQRETLVNLNIGFANSIASMQGYIEDGLNDLLNSVFQIVLQSNNEVYKNFNISQFLKYSLNPPLVLQLQNNESIISTIANIIGTLKQAQVNVDPIELFEMYAPQINWKKMAEGGKKEIKEQIKEQIMQQQAAPPQEEQQQ